MNTRPNEAHPPGDRHAAGESADGSGTTPANSDPVEPLRPIGEEVRTRRWYRRAEVLVAAGTLMLALVGGAVALALSGDDDPDDGVATIAGDVVADEDDDIPGGGQPPASDADMQDAMLAYAECMREQGVDIPDPQFDGDGGGMVISRDEGDGPSVSPGPGQEDFDAADEVCGEIMEGVRGDAEPPSPEEIAELQDQLVAMAECMRERGYDMPDPQVDADGRVAVQMQGGPGGPDDGEQMQQDQEECNQEAGLDGPRDRPSASGEDR